MRPDINFFHIARIELTPVNVHEADAECHAYTARDLILVGEDGQRFRITLFADGVNAAALTLPQEREARAVTP